MSRFIDGNIGLIETIGRLSKILSAIALSDHSKMHRDGQSRIARLCFGKY